MLQRNQLKTVFGGYDTVCAGNISPVPLFWSCHGYSETVNVCPEHIIAYNELITEFCGPL